MNRPGGYIDVDRLQAETTLEQAAALCGYPLVTKGSGPEVRIDCPFECPGDHAGRKEIAINTENPQSVFQCHAYQCGFRGNLLTLLHGWLAGTKPTGGKLKGEEFQRVKRVLARSGDSSQSASSSSGSPLPAPKVEGGEGPGVRVLRQPPSLPSGHSLSANSQQPSLSINDKPSTINPPLNLPLIDSPEPRIRELHNLDEKLIHDIATMNPAAAAYLRRHPCLTPEAQAKWRCGYLSPGSVDKRGWSLRGHILYPVLSESGKVLTWVGRDVTYEHKEKAWQSLSSVERQGKEPPAKHRFPKGFHRGQELFGQQASRLNEPGYREFIQEHGLILVEGFNDVINLDNLGIPSLAIMSNRMTDAQGEKMIRFAQQLGTTRVNLMFDCDDPGTAGAKDALWFFAQRNITVRLVWSPTNHEGQYPGKQPESLRQEEAAILLP